MIDIVTINKDNRDGLEKTILAVINQTKFDEINYIVIDGGSTDGSKEIVKKYKKYFGWSTTRKDKGIYNAMNKSLEHLKGEYVLFLNSGDYLVSNDVISKVLKYLHGETFIYGDEVLRYKQKRIGVVSKEVSYVEIEKPLYFPPVVNEEFFSMHALQHQATFIKTDYMKAHPYDENYRIISDWIMFREGVLENKVSYKHIPVVISSFDMYGISSNNGGMNEINDYLSKKDK
jgi:glycosyltransferase involved in cell wall biosynthesis